MKCIVSTACVLSVLVAVSFAAPYFPTQFSASSNLQVGGSSNTASVSASGTATSGTPAPGQSLTDILGSIDIPALLRSVNSIVKLVGVFCPPLSQVLDNVIQNVTSTAFRVFGRVILRNGLGGGGASSGGGASRVNVVLPTYPPDEDEDYDDEDEESASPGSDDNVDLRISQSSSTAASTQTASPASDDDNTVAKRHVRVIREAAEEEEEDDQDGAESAPQPSEDLSNVDTDDTDRNKRYSPFGAQVSAHGGAGSGNFLFDIIRLVAGSGATEESDEKIHGPGGVAELDISKSVEVGGHGHSGEGIPGPITRLFVIANRGLANLVQDLILRLASTSEKLVNFKARLVTSLI